MTWGTGVSWQSKVVCILFWLKFAYSVATSTGEAEKFVPLPHGGHVALSTRGPLAIRVRLVPGHARSNTPFETPMVYPIGADASYQHSKRGIVTKFGMVTVSSEGRLKLQKTDETVITESEPLSADTSSIVLSILKNSQLYGHGASPLDALRLTHLSSTPMLCNRATFAPYYYSTDGYGALGAVNTTKAAVLPLKYERDGLRVRWTFSGAFELYLIPAPTLTEGTSAYYQLIGAPQVPPRYAFGFIASRWGWKDRGYIEWIVKKFRKDEYPLDAIIVDFEWFTNETDYPFQPQGYPWYQDFGYNPVTFPNPKEQLSNYHQDFHIRMAGIRKPRLGNTGLLNMARSKGWIQPGGEPGGTYPPDLDASYAFDRCLNFSNPDVRDWYSKQIVHYLDDGVDFWWNDEGETDYFTYYWWNIAQIQALRSRNSERRFYSLNRAWSPGMARLGANVWTGDISATWADLQNTPGMMLNWILSGAPYVACDIGGFDKKASSYLLARWMQMGTFMPTMRIHNAQWETAHWPWRLGPNAAVVIKEALEHRYRLLPYHYSLAHMLYAKQALWIRPLVMEFPSDPNVWSMTQQWMDGDILVSPILTETSKRQVYLPNGTWYNLHTARTTKGPIHITGFAGLDEVPAFVRPGTILPLAPIVQYSDALPGGPLEVQVYAGADGSFSLIEDDGDTINYQTGELRKTNFYWNNSAATLSWKVSGPKPSRNAFVQLHIHIFIGAGISGRNTPHNDWSSKCDIGEGNSITMHSVQEISEFV